MYTDEMIKQRTALRNNKQVTNELDVWWRCAIHSHGQRDGADKVGDVQRSDAGAESSTAERGDGHLTQEGYVAVMSKLYKVMTEENEYDEDVAREDALEDWARDLQGGSTMTYLLWGDALFELVDLHTDTVRAEDYVEFLRELLSGWQSLWMAPPTFGSSWTTTKLSTTQSTPSGVIRGQLHAIETALVLACFTCLRGVSFGNLGRSRQLH